jgi:hypothetical protein
MSEPELSAEEIEALLAENLDADVPLSARTLRDRPAE